MDINPVDTPTLNPLGKEDHFHGYELLCLPKTVMLMKLLSDCIVHSDVSAQPTVQSFSLTACKLIFLSKLNSL